MEEPAGIEAGSAVIGLVDERISLRDQAALLPGPKLLIANDSAYGHEHDQAYRPDDDFEDRALDFVVRMFQVG